MMYYYAFIVKEEDSYIVSFPDLPDVNTYGETIDEAIEYAEDALNLYLEGVFERGFTVPEATEYSGQGYYRIEVRPHITLAYRLRQLRGERSQKEIAQELGVSYQAYQELENPRKSNPTVKTLEKLARVYGKRVEVKLQ